MVKSDLAITKVATSTGRRAVSISANGGLNFRHELKGYNSWYPIDKVVLTNVGFSKDYIVATNAANNIFWLDGMQ